MKHCVTARTQTRRKAISIIRLLAIACAICFLLSSAAHADNYDDMRAQWVTMQTGANNNMSDPDVAASVNQVVNSANSAWSSMNTSSGATYLWSDLTDFTKSATTDSNFGRLLTMATAYAQPGNSLQGSASLARAVAYGLDWLYTNHYNQNTAMYDNWWDWEIGDAKTFMTTALLIYPQLTSTEIANYTAAIDHFDPNPSYWYTTSGNQVTATGANLSDICLAVILRGVLAKDSTYITAGENALEPVYLYVTSGDGFYVDGSFIQHTYIAYTGGYGSALLSDMANLFLLLNNSAWPITDPNAGNVWNWVSQSYAPLMFRGAMMDMVGGRGVSRCGSWDHSGGRGIATALLRLSYGASPTEAAYIQGLVKEWVTEDTSWSGYVNACNTTSTPYSSYFSSLPAYDIGNLESLMSNLSVAAASPLIGNFSFAGMQRVVDFGPGFAFGLSLFSNKISAFECGNGENLHGWYTGLGMTYLYNADLQQYDNSYWPTVNPTRLAGTTTDSTTKTPKCSFESYLNTFNWVGGSVVDGLYGSTGMQFNLFPVTGSTLNGKKSWFWFGNKMVAMGAGINSTSPGAVETIVDNRVIDAKGDNALIVDGTTEPTTLGWSSTLANVKWAYMDGNVASSGIGYYFPLATSLYALRESRTGEWHDINTGGPTTTRTNNFLSLAFEHGAQPTDAGYAYVVLPNQTASSMAAYAASPDVTILENSTNAQAVYDASANAYGSNFWGTASHTVYDQNGSELVTASQPASVTMAQKGNELDVAVSDPTQANTGTLTLTLGSGASAVISADPEVTVTQLMPEIQLSVNVNGAAGKSFKAKFTTVSRITPAVTVTPGSSTIKTTDALAVTVAVAGGSGNPTPTGTVTLSSGSYTSAATALVSGSATINIPAGSLDTGSDTLLVHYEPDNSSASTYNSASGSSTVTVNHPTFAVSGGAVSFSAGATTGNTSTVTVTPSGGFTGNVALTAAVTSSPAGAVHPPTLSFGSTSPVSITGTGTATAMLTITTTAPTTSAVTYPARPGSRPYAGAGAVLACILLFWFPTRRRSWRALLGMLALLAVLVGGVAACNGGGGGGATTIPGTSPGNYTITVTGTSGSTTATGTVMVTVM